jgi:glycosyltransferase involved in cell wall biosynthesis
MRILYHHRTRRTGVEGVHIRGVINGFRKLGHEVIEVALVKETTNSNPSRVSPSSSTLRSALIRLTECAPNIFFRIMEINYNLIAFLKITRQLLKNKCEFIYERYAYFNYAGVLAKKIFKIPLLLEVNIVTDLKDTRDLVFSTFARFVENRAILAADSVFVVSDHLKDCLVARGYAPAKIHVQPNGYDPDEEGVIADLPQAIRQAVAGKQVIGFLGRLLPWYRLETLIDIFHSIYSRNPNTHLMFIGDGKERANLEALTSKLNLSPQVTFCGEVNHPMALALLDLVDIGVIPSTNEWTSPVKLFEYMGKGIPVVAPDIESVTTVMCDGLTGKTFRHGDYGDFAEKIEYLIINPEERRQLGEQARKYILMNHTWEKVARNIIAVGEEL